MAESFITINMQGLNGLATDSSGSSNIAVPQQFENTMGYINIQNLHANKLKIFAPFADPTTASPIFEIGVRMSISFRLAQAVSKGMKIYFENQDSSTVNEVKQLQISFSDFDKKWSHSYAQSYGGSGATSDVNIKSPLSGSAVLTQINNPADLDFNDYTSIPLTSTQTNAVTNLVVNGVTGKSIRLSFLNWRVSGTAAIGASNVPVTIKDGATIIYQSAIPATSANGVHLEQNFTPALKLTPGNDLTISIGASGAANCIIYTNAGAFIK